MFELRLNNFSGSSKPSHIQFASSVMELLQKYPWRVAVLLIISIFANCNQQVNPSVYRNQDDRRSSVIKKTQPARRPNQKTVLVKCHEDSLEIVVNCDLFDIGILVKGSDLQLGSNSIGKEDESCGAIPTGEAAFTIFAHLTACGTIFSSTETALVYSNVLIYSPSISPDGVHILEAATIPIECRYGKKYTVDSAALAPLWIPYSSMQTAEDQLEFRLRLMSDDWRAERESNTYSLGEVVHLEAAVAMRRHMPLRVYVDHCVATETPDTESYSHLRHDFIDNYGCLTDGQLTGSGSRFVPRIQNDKLHVMLDAFRFFQANTNTIFITCRLKAVPAVYTVDSRNRACSFIVNSWRSADGNDQASTGSRSTNLGPDPESLTLAAGRGELTIQKSGARLPLWGPCSLTLLRKLSHWTQFNLQRDQKTL
ncbi:hypothetical protein UPYG_G00297530 [Umbra pygmaea]|uniref:Zona pellucida sperm-binding protein 3 n=1 Tax=Umbra pygmaea TaxID=75934 RepID=A0ABD0WAJ4_UMBPY